MTSKELLDYVPTIEEQEIYRKLEKHYHLHDLDVHLCARYNKDIHDLDDDDLAQILLEYECYLDKGNGCSFSCESAIRDVLGDEFGE